MGKFYYNARVFSTPFFLVIFLLFPPMNMLHVNGSFIRWMINNTQKNMGINDKPITHFTKSAYLMN